MSYYMLAETTGETVTKFILPNLYMYLADTLGLGNDFTVNMILFVSGILICMVIPYLLGSINPAIMLSNKMYHDDIRTHGSGNAGTTNTLRTYGKKAAIIVLVLDMLKAAIAVSIGALIMPYHIGGAIAGIFVVLGHMFPIYYKFRGGKGVACLVSVVLIMSPLSFCIVFPLFVALVLLTRYVSLASIMCSFLLPLIHNAFYVKGADNPSNAWITAAFTVIMVLVIFKHRENLKRLLAGKESKVSFGLGAKKEREEKKAKKDIEDDNS